MRWKRPSSTTSSASRATPIRATRRSCWASAAPAPQRGVLVSGFGPSADPAHAAVLRAIVHHPLNAPGPIGWRTGTIRTPWPIRCCTISATLRDAFAAVTGLPADGDRPGRAAERPGRRAGQRRAGARQAARAQPARGGPGGGRHRRRSTASCERGRDRRARLHQPDVRRRRSSPSSWPTPPPTTASACAGRRAPRRFVVDYSAPNVAKEMHVGHLRTTVIGDALVRLLTFVGHKVIRENHIGDWGTPFGMLIEHLLDLGETEAANELSVGDLDGFYREARAKFDADDDVQGARPPAGRRCCRRGDAETLRLWQPARRREHALLQRSCTPRSACCSPTTTSLGESAYNDAAARGRSNACATPACCSESDGADVVFPPGFTNRDGEPLPLIVQKRGRRLQLRDHRPGLRHRPRRAARAPTLLLYVVGAPQSAAPRDGVRRRRDGRLAAPADARPCTSRFGNVLGTDRKMFKSRSGETVKLIDLLDEAVERATAAVAREEPGPARRRAAPRSREMVGIGAREVRRPVDRPDQGLRVRLGPDARVRRQHRAVPAVRARPDLQHLPPRRASTGDASRRRRSAARRAAGARAGPAPARLRRRRAATRSSGTARTGCAPTCSSWPRTFTAFYEPARCSRRADEATRRSRLALCDAHRAGARHRASTCSASTPRSGCERVARPDASRRSRRRCCPTRRARRRRTARCASAAARSPSSPRSTARRCSSTTRPTCATAAARRSPRSATGSVVYATKAFLCTAMARLAYEEGHAARRRHRRRAARRPRRRRAGRRAASLHGNNKSVDELRMAIDGRRPPHRRRQLRRARPPRRAARRGAAGARRSLLRITPGVARPHPRVHRHRPGRLASSASTSATATRMRAVERCARSPRVRLVGAALPHRLERVRGVELRQGRRGDGRLRRAARPARAGPRRRPRRRLRRRRGGADDHRSGRNVLLDACAALGVRRRVSVEPGRSIVAAAAITVYTVGTIKDIPGIRTYVAVDGGMSDNPRPVLYGSGYEAFLPRAVGAERPRAARLVGKHCESGDVLVFDAARARRPRASATCSATPGHRRLRPLDGQQLQQGHPPAGRVRRATARPASSCAARPTTTCSRCDVG